MATSSNPIEKLTPDQVQALAALLTEKDVKTAAAKAGCGETTLHRWLREDADFKAALHAAEAQLIDTAVRRLAVVAGDALDVLTTIMKNKRTAAGVRVRAATVVMEQLIKLRELNNLEERIAALEASRGDNK
jgi:hypothetical protein